VTHAVLFVVASVGGAAALALWVDVRFPALAPESLTARLLALVVAGLAADAGSRLFAGVLAVESVGAGRGLAALGVLLPGLTVAFLAGLWLLRSLQSLATR
jgi:hypothetical protein